MPRKALKKRADGRYMVQYNYRQFYGKTQAEALRKRDEYKQALKDGMQTTCPTVAVYASAWLPAHKGTVSTKCYNDYAKQLDALFSLIGTLPLNAVTPTDIKKVYTQRYDGYSGYTIKRAKMLFTAVFDSAIADGYIRTNPCRAKTAQPHKGPEGSHRSLTPEEDKLLLTVDHPFRPVVLAMRYAGLRRGEALALNITRDVNFTENTITVSRAIAYTSNQPILKKPKSDAGTRTIPLLDPLRSELLHVTGYLAKAQRSNGIMSERAFRSAWDSYIHAVECHINGYSQKRWYGKTAADRATLEAGKELPPWQTFDIRPHDLRHSYCTMLRDAGIDMHICMEWMGHADEKMILKIYDHVTPIRRAHAIQQLCKNIQQSEEQSEKIKIIKFPRNIKEI